MKVLRADNHRRMPWKNGGGETLEVAVFPADAGIGTFDWRVSMAVVASDGPFSAFPGIDRTLVLLDGDGMLLDIAGRAPVSLTSRSEPCAFPADVATSATLVGGAITDLNVMTARGRLTHAVERFDGARNVAAGPYETLLLLGDGLIVESMGDAIALGPRDVVLVDAGERARAIPAGERGLLVTIGPAR